MALAIGILLLVTVGYYYFPEKSLPAQLLADSLVVHKSARQLEVFAHGLSVKTYTISLGENPVGPKHFEGDGKTPEGLYMVNDKSAVSAYHKNLGISYPNLTDRKFALNQHRKPGGDIKIHGLKNGRGWIGKFHRFYDWTNGCMALTNPEIDALYDAVAVGTPVYIYP